MPQKKLDATPSKPTPLSRFIARRLSDLEITQADLARRLNVHQSYVSHIVTGRRVPDVDAPDFLRTYATALEVDEDTFIAEAELWRYNIVPPGPAEVSPADRAVLAAIGHLPQETRARIARALRDLFPATLALSSEEQEFVKQAFHEAVPGQGEAALGVFLDLLARHGGVAAIARSAMPAEPPAQPPPPAPAAPEPRDRPGTG